LNLLDAHLKAVNLTNNDMVHKDGELTLFLHQLIVVLHGLQGVSIFLVLESKNDSTDPFSLHSAECECLPCAGK
jgi:hypothetical protein